MLKSGAASQFGEYHPIAGVARARDDVAVVVQSFVNGGRPYRDFAANLMGMGYVFGSHQQTY